MREFFNYTRDIIYTPFGEMIAANSDLIHSWLAVFGHSHLVPFVIMIVFAGLFSWPLSMLVKRRSWFVTPYVFIVCIPVMAIAVPTLMNGVEILAADFYDYDKTIVRTNVNGMNVGQVAEIDIKRERDKLDEEFGDWEYNLRTVRTNRYGGRGHELTQYIELPDCVSYDMTIESDELGTVVVEDAITNCYEVDYYKIERALK